MQQVDSIFTSRERLFEKTGFAAPGSPVIIIPSAEIGNKRVHIAYYEVSVTQIEEGQFRLVQGIGNDNIRMPWVFDTGIIIPYKRRILTRGNELKIITTHANGVNYEVHYFLDD